MQIFNQVMRSYLAYKHHIVRDLYTHPHQKQAYWFEQLMQYGSKTAIGKSYGLYPEITPDAYRRQIPLQDYNDLKPYIRRMMLGEEDLLWPGKINWYSKSSGTTEDRSKYIPVSAWNLKSNHISGFTSALSMVYAYYGPEANLFLGKSMTMGGSIQPCDEYPQSFIGDISAIILFNMPMVGKYFYALEEDTAFIEDWEEKIERAAKELLQEKHVTMFGGVPSWNIVLFSRMLELSGKQHMLEIWPQARSYIHGGVGFEPYRTQFEALFPRRDFIYQEIYNASEGFFAAQDRFDQSDMLLMLHHGIYFEFLPLAELDAPEPQSLLLSEVKTGVQYALIITTNAGLWRYLPGDVIEFTQLEPYRIKITGRTKHYINAFGEELMIHNAEEAMRRACREHHASIRDFTAAPLFFEGRSKAAHEWLVEFIKAPADISRFADSLDAQLQSLNSDYAAKRYRDLALERLHLRVVPADTFMQWMKKNNKFGAQNKMPRLHNTRKYLDDILLCIKTEVF